MAKVWTKINQLVEPMVFLQLENLIARFENAFKAL